MRVLQSIIGLIIFILSVFLGLYLLNQNQFSGSEFVAFVVSFAVLGLVISFSSEVQEFSIAGNIVKLKEVKKDAKKSIAELKSARTETFRFLLSLAKRHPGGWGSESTVDLRLADFWFLYAQIDKFGCRDELKLSISETLEELLRGQLSSIGNESGVIREKYSGEITFPPPDELCMEIMDNASIEKTARRGVCKGSIEEIKKNLAEGLKEYRKLYDLHVKLGKI